jgi:hypothetical protein
MSRCAFLIAVVSLAATLLAAQSPDAAVEITREPHHHLTFVNHYVRVFSVEIDANTQTLTHWHRHDYIAVTLGDAEVANTMQGKPTAALTLPKGDTRFAAGNFAHYVRVVGPQPFRNVTVELLQDASLRDSVAQNKVHWDEDRGLDILDHGTKQILFVKDGVRATEFELQPGGVLPMHHYAGPHLLIAVSDLDLRTDVPPNAPTSPQTTVPGHFKSGDSKWLPANYSHALTNTGSAPAKFVTLEFP